MSNVKVHIIGRLGANAELRKSKNGKDFATFDVAVDEFTKGEKKTTWFTVADFSDNVAKRATLYKKGSLVEIQGIETCRIYYDRNKAPQIARDIRSTLIEFIPIGKQNNDSANNSQTETANSQAVSITTATAANNTDVEDDLPF